MKDEVLYLMGGIGNQSAILAFALKEMDNGKKVRLSDFKFKMRTEKRMYLLPNYFNLEDCHIDISFRVWDVIIYYFIRFISKVYNHNINELNLFGVRYRISYCQEHMIENVKLLRPFIKHIPNVQSQITIHVRRGDYTERRHRTHGLVSISSVKQILTYLIELHKIYHVNIISEDSSIFDEFQADRNFSNVEFVNHTQSSETEAFYLMLSSKIMIATNSTFSVLAGVLGLTDLWIPQTWSVNGDSNFLGEDANRYRSTLL